MERPVEEVDLLAATIRAPDEEPGVLFGGTRGMRVSYTDIVLSLPPGRAPGTIQWPSRLPGDPEHDMVATSVAALTAEGVHEWFRTRHGSKRRVFVYVHGFNTRFDVAVYRLAQLVTDAGIDAAPVLFSWPSRGRLLDFKLDHQNATFARSDLASLLRTAAESPEVDEITILAHSMGSWLAMEALRQISLEDGGISPKIKDLMLASPELDIGLFRRELLEMGDQRPAVVLFVSRNDRALRLSRLVSGGMTRLGGIDVNDEVYQAQLADIPRLTIFDLTEVNSTDFINHSLYLESPEVVRLIGARLAGGQVLTDDSAANVPAAAGGLVGAVFAAPIVILDGAALAR